MTKAKSKAVNQSELRDWFAGQALLATPGETQNPTLRAALSYALADELIKVREWSYEELANFISPPADPQNTGNI